MKHQHKFTLGAVYRVKMCDPPNPAGRIVRRIFYGHTFRFGDLPCYEFSSKVGRSYYPKQIVSIPEYILVHATLDPNQQGAQPKP